MAFNSRVAIIAGAFGGIGLATGRQLQAQGAKLALLYAPFEASRTQQVRNTYAKNGSDDIATYECDITDPKSVEAAFDAIAGRCSASSFPSILVNAAGYDSGSPLEDMVPEEAVKQLHINLLGPMLVSQAFAKLFFRWSAEAKGKKKPARPGRIVSIASQAAHVAIDNHSAYCATANTVSPCPVWTEIARKAWSDAKVQEAYEAKIPIGRFAEPEEVADTVVHLCKDESTMINGADIRLDGGFTTR